MTAFLIIYLYVMGWCMTVVAVADDVTFKRMNTLTQTVMLALWPVLIPIALVERLVRWVVRKWRRRRPLT